MPHVEDSGLDALIGRDIGQYRIHERIGSGGQGVVYRATDLKMGRQVAIKMLLAEKGSPGGSDPGHSRLALAALLQEARGAAPLPSHSNICAVHAVEEVDGHVFIAMEYVSGENLLDRMEGGPLPFFEVCRIGEGVARALAHIHEHHVAHRDLKTANVVLARDGQPKLLDFGVARPLDIARQQAWDITATGKPAPIVGTWAYLPPEVLAGSLADERGDIWALGVLLYEMAMGSRPFPGHDAETVRAAQQSGPLPLRAELPAVFRNLVGSCLERSRDRRTVTAAEIAGQLAELRDRPRPGRWHRTARIAATVLPLLALAGLLSPRWIQPGAPAPGVHARPLTAFAPGAGLLAAALSPDGDHMVWVDATGWHELRVETHEVRDLPGNPDLPRPRASLATLCWFPDGAHLLFAGACDPTGTSRMWQIANEDGRATPLGEGRDPAVSSDGASIAFVRPTANGAQLWIASGTGENPRRLAQAPRGTEYASPVWSPRGDRIACLALATGARADDPSTTTIEVHGVRGRGATTLPGATLLPSSIDGGRRLCWLADGRILYCRADSIDAPEALSLWASARPGPCGGPAEGPSLVCRSGGFEQTGLGTSRGGKQLFVMRSRTGFGIAIARIEADSAGPGSVRSLSLEPGLDAPIGWSPDSRTLLFVTLRGDTPNVFLQDIDSRFPRPVAEGAGCRDWAAVTPDGRGILYTERPLRGEEGGAQLKRVQFTGGPAQSIADFGPEFGGIACGTRAGSACVFCEQLEDRRVFYRIDPSSGARMRLADAHWSRADRAAWRLSPDGTRVAMPSLNASASGVRVLDLRSGVERTITAPGFEHAEFECWAADGGSWFRILEGLSSGRLVHVTADGRSLVGPGLDLARGLVASPDGKFIAFSQRLRESNVWVLEGF